jgi:GT2 family glycosyltransferase
MSCDIIIPVWDQLDNTRNCLEHLVKNTSYPYWLILIDNASGADTKKYLEEFAAGRPGSIRLVRNETNLGFVKAVNQGMRLSDAPYVCVMNNDIVPGTRWLENLVEFAETHRDIGLMNPLCNGHGSRTVEEYARIVETENKDRYMEMNQCFGFCMLIKREVIDKIGVLDERFGMGGFDDTDYSMRAHIAGYGCASVHSSYVYHREHASFNAMGDRKKLVARAEEEYFKKWPRHLRVGVGVSIDPGMDGSEIENLLNGVLYLARQWCWVNLWIFGNSGENKERINRAAINIGMPLHQNIKFNYLPGAFVSLQLLTRLIERSFGTKRRKKYDIFLVDNAKSQSLLKIFYPLHRSSLYLVEPGKDLAPLMREKISKLRKEFFINAQRTTHNAQRICSAT